MMMPMMKIPSDSRPTWRGGVLQIHVTRACDLACNGCTQGSQLAGKPVIMSTKQFEDAVISLKDYNGVVGVFGGNPCVHPEFPELCHILAKHIPFEQRGLWSNNLRGYGKLCRNTFNPEYSNLNVHCDSAAYEEMLHDWPESKPKGLHDSRHSPPWVAIKDVIEDKNEMWRMIHNCDINQLWSAMIGVFRNELRGWFCEIAGAQSMLHEHEKDYPDTGLPIEDGWWKKSIESFYPQINKHCPDCGIPLRGFGSLAMQGTDDFVSKTHESIYKLKRPTGKVIKLVTKKEELGGEVPRATDYCENGYITPVEIKGEKPETRILIGIPTGEFGRHTLFYDYLELLDKPVGTFVSKCHGQSPARGRNVIIEEALRNNCTHVLFLDDDMAFPPNTMSKLLAHDKDMVTGLYLMRNYPHQPVIFDKAMPDGKAAHHFFSDGEKGLMKIVAAGAGCVLINTRVFKGMPEFKDGRPEWGARTWFTLGELEKDHWCDDIAFYLRAQKAGFELFVDLDCPVGHMGVVTLWPNRINDVWNTSYDTYGKEVVNSPQVTRELAKKYWDEKVPENVKRSMVGAID